ncbi:unnamed protein product [Rhizoctonia solani]|uniref:Uncharacterized protein n=1 Tax=Rhizoctonia solani TaxID=456999 RepID=A0A8H3C3U6_9AGAM|nr:unnamed protein product [Rhizoctonia solani]
MQSTVELSSEHVNDDSSAVELEASAGTEQAVLATREDLSAMVDKSGEPAAEIDKLTPSFVKDTSLTATPANAVADQPNLQLHSITILPSFSKSSNFFRNVQWCADGSSLLGATEHASLEILNMTGEGNEVELKPRLSLLQPAPILSTAWFPTASALDPAAYCFVAAIRDTPIKLFDASDGRV